MSELHIIQGYIQALEAKIAIWFQKHFGELDPDSKEHKTATVAHQELKSIITPSPTLSEAAPTSEATPPTA